MRQDADVAVNNGLFSCIVPTLNEKDTIGQFIMSIHAQDYRPIELLIIDGGSTDGTRNIVQDNIIHLNDSSFSVRLFKEANYGVISSPANARNIGLNEAQGDFLLFIDSDTKFLSKETVSTLIEQIGTNDYILIPFKPLIDTKLEEKTSQIFSADGIFLYRREFIADLRFVPTLGFGEDREFNYRLFGSVKSSGNELTASVCIGRHFPHTKEELKKQNVWYGRTILNYIRSVYYLNKKESIHQLVYLIYNVIVGISPILFFITCIFSYEVASIILVFIMSLIAVRFILLRARTLNMLMFFTWYSIYSGIYFTKGLLMSVHNQKRYGRN